MMQMTYDATVDAAFARVREAIRPEEIADAERLDADRFVRYDAEGHALVYEFLNAKRFGVRLDDLEHREELARLFKGAGFQEREWSHPIPTTMIHRRDRAAG